MHLPLRREGVRTVAIALANAPVAAVDEQLRFLVSGDFSPSVNRFPLSFMHRRWPRSPFRLDRPPVRVRHHVLVSFRHVDRSLLLRRSLARTGRLRARPASTCCKPDFRLQRARNHGLHGCRRVSFALSDMASGK